MKALRGLLLLAMVLVFAAGALADSIDPTITVRGTYTGIPVTEEEGGNRFPFTVNSSGGGIFTFTNTGADIVTLGVVMATPAGVIICSGDDVFTMCSVMSPGEGGGEEQPLDATSHVVISFSGPPGIPSGGTFTIDLGTSGWVPGSSSFALANVPEPGTLSLFLAGVGALVARRKRRV